MNSRLILPQVLNFVLYVTLQIVVFRNLVLFDVAFCYVYIAFLLLLPLEIGVMSAMLLGFVSGLFVDVFYNTFGIHAAASVFIMYIRRQWLDFITPRGGYDIGTVPSPKVLGIRWFVTYAFPLILIHHALIFFIEVISFELFSYTLAKIVASAVFTLVVATVTQYILYSSPRRRTVL